MIVKRSFCFEDKELTGNFPMYFDESFQNKRNNFQQEALTRISQNYSATIINKKGKPVAAFLNNQRVTKIFGISRVFSDESRL